MRLMLRSLTPLSLLALMCALAPGAYAGRARNAPPPVAATPPLGWNSWDSYGLSISDEEWRANVDWLHQHLQPVGWQYAVVDEGWYLADPPSSTDKRPSMDPYGRYIAPASRFPDGIAGLAAYAHAEGLRFGLHILHGIPKAAVTGNLPIADSGFHAADAADPSDACAWNNENDGVKDGLVGQAYYDSLLKLYAGWGLDYLKVDCIAKPYNAHEIRMIAAAIAKTGRPIVLSLSPGPVPLADALEVAKYAQAWRISNDVWDIWSDPAIPEGEFPQTVRRQFTDLSQWAQFAGPGHWPDADMLPLGYLGPRPGWGQPRVSRLNYDETRTMLTLWAIARSPLMLGANLPQIDSFTEALLTNREWLDVDQHSSGNRELLVDGSLVVWRADAPKSAGGGHKGTYYAVFNLGNGPATFRYRWKQLSLHGGEHRVRDLWQGQDMGRVPELAGTLPAHGSALFRVE